MELAILIVILVVVWYYGHMLRGDVLVAAHDIHTALSEIKDSVDQVSKNTAELEQRLDKCCLKFDDFMNSVNVDWKYFNKEKMDVVLKKLESIEALSGDLESINATLQSLENSVDSIAAHPAFTWPKKEK